MHHEINITEHDRFTFKIQQPLATNTFIFYGVTHEG